MAATLAEQLRALDVQGILVQMAERGEIAQLRCMASECYCPEGRDCFEVQLHPPGPWAPSVGHEPLLKMDGGKRTSDNVQLEHVRCNNLAYKWLEMPLEKRAAAVAKWRQKYSKDHCSAAIR